MIKLVHHHNFIGHEINESLEFYADDVLDREIYCRKLHTIKEPLTQDCNDCPCFAGWEQGHGHECVWDDVVDEIDVRHDDRYKEFERVDKLIKQGILKSDVCDCTVFKVKNLDYDKEQWIYEESDDKVLRYILGTKGKKSLICFGVNPSTASPNDLDPTMKNVEFFARNNGYDSYIMLNLYPVRATNPNDLDKEQNIQAARENLKFISTFLQQGNFDIWAAWGTLISKREYLKSCLKEIAEVTKQYNCHWYSIGDCSKDGHPHHPLYLNRHSAMEVFDIDAYLANLNCRG